jgi:regulator of extracellular matrix RemA (YlzA/DUF370 family)
VALFPGHLPSTSLSALPVMRMISNAKGIISVAKTVQSHKTRIVPVVDVTVLVIEILIDVESSANRFSEQPLAVRKQHLSSGWCIEHEADYQNFLKPTPVNNIKQA